MLLREGLMSKRWVVLSLDALATSAIGVYGSPWNETSSIDKMATLGTVWDRAIATSDDSVEQLAQLWGQTVGDDRWVNHCHKVGRVELYLNAGPQAVELAKLAEKFAFDQCTFTESVPESLGQDALACEEIELTSMAKLLLPVLERLSDTSESAAPDWSVMWVHSDSLARHWDAPRWLFPIEEDEEDEEPIDQVEWSLADFEAQSRAGGVPESTTQKPPAIFESVSVPFFALSPDAHPDWITSWMQTYGCQVRLLDRLVSILLDAIQASGENIGLAMIGTSGISMGQNGWIGHRAGTIRSPQIHVPVILFDGEGAGLRLPGLRSINEVMHYLVASEEGSSRITPEQWASDGTADDTVIETVSHRAERVLTTQQWFFVREGDHTRLFLKPDDRDDMNDIADRCRDVVESMESTVSSSSREP